MFDKSYVQGETLSKTSHRVICYTTAEGRVEFIRFVSSYIVRAIYLLWSEDSPTDIVHGSAASGGTCPPSFWGGEGWAAAAAAGSGGVSSAGGIGS